MAAVTIPDAQVKQGDVTLVATFATTKLIQDMDYAVVVSRPAASNLTLRTSEDGDACTGDLFVASGGGVFEISSQDMIVTVLVR